MRTLAETCRERAALWGSLAENATFTEKQQSAFRALCATWERLAATLERKAPSMH
jgi:hypothetical protein